MANVRVEFMTLGTSPGFDNHSSGVLKALLGTPVKLAVSSTATVAASRPVAPNLPSPANPARADYGRIYARVTAIDGNVIVQTGSDPTAAQTNGVLVLAGSVEPIPLLAGEKLSFIELA